MFSSETFVPSGSFELAGDKKEKLTALLGTCIGLVLVDRKNNSGGLYHILLPEPAGSVPPGEELSFASSGLPIFFKAVLDHGAARENLQATLCGGALMGPVSFQDLELDIGGRTAEYVRVFLKKNNIPIVREETGGVNATRCVLNTETMEFSVANMRSEPAGHKTFQPPPPKHTDIEKSIALVKPIPQVALKITRLLRLGKTSLAAIALELEQDQVLAAKVLQQCNSPFYGMPGTVTSLDRALVVLGEVSILEIVLSLSVQNFFNMEEGGYSLMRGGLFRHAQAVAAAARNTARQSGVCDPETAFTAGLLHDIGKVVLDQYIRNLDQEFYRLHSEQTTGLAVLEHSAFGMDHQEAGYLLAKQWLLPEEIAAAIRDHHAPDPEKHAQLVSVVHIADQLAARFLTGIQRAQIDPRPLKTALLHIGLTAADLPRLVSSTPWGTYQQPDT